eukprot:1180699-Prorocentrum_minimum.AAC.1
MLAEELAGLERRYEDTKARLAAEYDQVRTYLCHARVTLVSRSRKSKQTCVCLRVCVSVCLRVCVSTCARVCACVCGTLHGTEERVHAELQVKIEAQEGRYRRLKSKQRELHQEWDALRAEREAVEAGRAEVQRHRKELASRGNRLEVGAELDAARLQLEENRTALAAASEEMSEKRRLLESMREHACVPRLRHTCGNTSARLCVTLASHLCRAPCTCSTLVLRLCRACVTRVSHLCHAPHTCSKLVCHACVTLASHLCHAPYTCSTLVYHACVLLVSHLCHAPRTCSAFLLRWCRACVAHVVPQPQPWKTPARGATRWGTRAVVGCGWVALHLRHALSGGGVTLASRGRWRRRSGRRRMRCYTCVTR